ncbi:hypothetical protein D3C77_723670 [compost metagenome]
MLVSGGILHPTLELAPLEILPCRIVGEEKLSMFFEAEQVYISLSPMFLFGFLKAGELICVY